MLVSKSDPIRPRLASRLCKKIEQEIYRSIIQFIFTQLGLVIRKLTFFGRGPANSRSDPVPIQGILRLQASEASPVSFILALVVLVRTLGGEPNLYL